MSERRGGRDRLQDIVDWGARLDRHLAMVDFDAFAGNLLVQDAVIRCIEVVGEASGRLLRDPSIRGDLFSTMDLQGDYAAGSKLSYGQGSFDPSLVWNAAKQSVPVLAAEVQRILDQIDKTL